MTCAFGHSEQGVAAFADAVRESIATVGVWMPRCHADLYSLVPSAPAAGRKGGEGN